MTHPMQESRREMAPGARRAGGRASRSSKKNKKTEASPNFKLQRATYLASGST